jgi:hypothetical protein
MDKRTPPIGGAVVQRTAGPIPPHTLPRGAGVRSDLAAYMADENNMTNQDFDAQIDHGIIQAASDKLAAVRLRLANVTADMETARAKHTAAKLASDAAIAGEGDPIAAELALEEAARGFSVAGRIVEAAQRAVEQARADELAERGKAHQPMHDAAVTAVLAACATADTARTTLATAECAFRDAVKAIRGAVARGARPAHGHQDPDGTSPSLTQFDGKFVLPTELEVIKRFGRPVV